MAREALLKLCFPVIVLLMILIGGLLTLLSILWAIVTHPFTVFKKVNRNGTYHQECTLLVSSISASESIK